MMLSFLIYGCGVKGPPRPPAGTAVPSYLDAYLKSNDQSTLSSPNDEENTSDQEAQQKVSK